MRSLARILFAGSAAAILLMSSPTAQSGGSTSQQPQPQPRFRTEANFVRVDAYPTKDGRPLTDLQAADFEVFEDGAPQTIETFEHVVISPAGPQTERREPNSTRDMLQAVANPRSRVFVVFLDDAHAMVTSSHNIIEPLIKLINNVLGPDDLIAVMTTSMTASQIVFARRTEVTEEQLRRHWTWGRRDSIRLDEREQLYEVCYPPLRGERSPSQLATQLITRKRERAVLEALQDLVRYLREIREERKAILTITEGWVLYRPDPSAMKIRRDPVTAKPFDPVPTTDPVTVGPDGTLTAKDPRRGDGSRMECDADRLRLSAMDNDEFFRTILDEANRANASFYPIDPRGLPAFDSPIGPAPPPPPAVDQAILRTRQHALRTLAEGTDGIAVMNNNDLDKGLRRISDDLTSYYLLGYYSTNTKLDGAFRSLKVRVKRPGVAVRARRGYRAATTEEVAAARAAAEPPAPKAASAVDLALTSLANVRPDSRFRLYAAVAPAQEVVWVVGELASNSGRAGEWSQGATADVEVKAGDGTTTGRVSLRPGERAFLLPLKIPAGARDLDVRARVSSTDAATSPVSDAIRVVSGSARPVMYRRGPSTVNRQQPTADPLFSRSDRLRLEQPVAASVTPGSGRLLDRSGQPLAVPVTVGQRTDDASGQRWITADVILAPLAPGDYAIEVGAVGGGTESRVVTAIRVTR